MQASAPQLRQSLRRMRSAAVRCAWLVFVLAATAGNSANASEPVSVEPAPLLTESELRELVAPVALYSDELLAIVLPASTYPLQIVAAARYRDAVVNDPSLKPDEYWDESIVALLNYPEALAFLNADLDWTWSLGQAVTDQQAAVLAAVSTYREEAYAAGNLESDDKHVVAVDDDVVTIKSADPEVIHVPYYEPEQVTIYQTERVYHYYPTAYPVYYYPYSSWHRFYDHGFWGINSAFVLSWSTFHLGHHMYTHHYHPYFGRRYHRNHFRYTHRYISAPAYQKRHKHRPRHHGDDYRWQPDRRWSGNRPSRTHRRIASIQPQPSQLLSNPQRPRSSVHREPHREINSVRPGTQRSSVHRPAPPARVQALQGKYQFKPKKIPHQQESARRRAQDGAPHSQPRSSAGQTTHQHRQAAQLTRRTEHPRPFAQRQSNRAEGSRRASKQRITQQERPTQRPQRSRQFDRQSSRTKLPRR